jgi:hypothetical protein
MWLAEVHARWPVSRTGRVAAVLADTARQRSSLTVTLDAATVRRLILQAHLRPPGLQQILRRLTGSGLLTSTLDHDPTGWGCYLLTMPTDQTAERATASRRRGDR